MPELALAGPVATPARPLPVNDRGGLASSWWRLSSAVKKLTGLFESRPYQDSMTGWLRGCDLLMVSGQTGGNLNVGDG